MTSVAGCRRNDVRRGDSDAIVVLARDGVEIVCWPLPGCRRPDMALVDELAQLQLAAGRLGCSIRLRDACAELVELLDLVGLAVVLADGAGSVVEVEGKGEDGEQVDVEEVVVADDPVA
jgi:hypothetical protein